MNSAPSHGRVELIERTKRAKMERKPLDKDYKRSPINPLDNGFLATCCLAKARWLHIACDFHNGKGLRRLDVVRISLSNKCDLGVRGREKEKIKEAN